MEGEESVSFALGAHSPIGSAGGGRPLTRSLSHADAGRINETFERMRALVGARLDARRTDRDRMFELVCHSHIDSNRSSFFMASNTCDSEYGNLRPTRRSRPK